MTDTSQPRAYGPNPRRRPRPKTLEQRAELHEKVQTGVNAAHLANYAELVLKNQEVRIRNKVFAQIDSDDPLNPDKAAQAWIELRSAYKLIKDLRSAQKAGERAHLRLSEDSQEGE